MALRSIESLEFVHPAQIKGLGHGWHPSSASINGGERGRRRAESLNGNPGGRGPVHPGGKILGYVFLF